MRLAIITTHPIQYYAPVFKLLQHRGNIDITVFYTWGNSAADKYDPDFDKTIEWDIPLLDGYPYQWVTNTSPNPGSHHFKGIINPGLIDQLNKWQPDAILVFGWAYRSHLKVLRHFKGKVPVYFRGDSTLLDEKKGARAFVRTLFLKWVYKHVDHAFYVGANNKAYFKKHGLTEGQLSFAPHAIDNERFAEPRANEAKELRERLGIDKNDIVILFAGKLEDKKAPDLLLDAFLNLSMPNVHLLFAGSGYLKNMLVQKAKEQKNIHFTDFQNQLFMPVVYQACNLFCLPSKGPGETWGLAVNEAMACSKAVLTSNKVGCAADLVTADNGAIFRSGSIHQLSEGLKKLLSDKEELIKMGRVSARIINSYNFLAIAKAIESKVLNIKTNLPATNI